MLMRPTRWLPSGGATVAMVLCWGIPPATSSERVRIDRSPLMAGVLGGLLATWVTFVPCTLADELGRRGIPFLFNSGC